MNKPSNKMGKSFEELLNQKAIQMANKHLWNIIIHMEIQRQDYR